AALKAVETGEKPEDEKDGSGTEKNPEIVDEAQSIDPASSAETTEQTPQQEPEGEGTQPEKNDEKNEGEGTEPSKEEPAEELTEKDFLAQIEKQEVKVISTQYIDQGERYKALYPDMLQAVFQNKTELELRHAVVAFAAWDETGLPVKIKGAVDFTEGAYIRQVNYRNIHMIPSSTHGRLSGFKVDDTCGIKDFKAIVVSYEALDGTVWENPLYDTWRQFYEGVELKPVEKSK
ncbi:MAG: hypothetical protein IIW19_05500, partial [Clostridia bacterium]|nr:hypothetical protein [Clostridia bacterium]